MQLAERSVCMMDTRVALISVVVESYEHIDELNAILHNYNEFIIGRMGVPYRKKNISVISVAVDAPQDIINAMSGKLGHLKGISVKTLLSKV